MTKLLPIIVGRRRPERENMFSTLVSGLEKEGFSLLSTEEPLPTRETIDDLDGLPVVVYTSSKERFPRVYAECERRRIPLIIVSSIEAPKDPSLCVIPAPNLALPIVALFDVLPRFGKFMQSLGAETDVAECHQPSKTSPPITAQTIAGFFGLPPESVGSVRNKAIARAFAYVPERFIDGHGSHMIVTNACDVEVRISFRTFGRSAYLKGLLQIFATLEANPELLQQPGILPVPKILFK